MPNQLSLDAILWGCKNQSDEVGAGEGFRGGGEGVVWALAHKELDIVESEGVLFSVGNSLVVLSWA